MLTPLHTPSPRRRSRSKPGSILLFSLIATTMAAATVIIMVSASAQARVQSFSAMQQSDTIRYATNALEYGCAAIKKTLNQPSASTPDIALRNFVFPDATSGTYASLTALDTDRYSVLGVTYSIPTNPVKNWDRDTAPAGAGFNGRITGGNPANVSNPALNVSTAEIWTVPVQVAVTVQDKRTGRRTTATVSCNLNMYYSPFLQYCYYFNDVNGSVCQGVETRIRGGVFANKSVFLCTNDTTSYSLGSIMQVDNVAAKFVSFNNTYYGQNGSNLFFNGIYISTGDVNGNGKLDFFPNKNSPISDSTYQYNPYDADKTKVKADFLPAFLTLADYGDTSLFKNYFAPLTSGNMTGSAVVSPNAATISKKYNKIDSANPNVTAYAQRFNGNYKDQYTGFVEQYPANLPSVMTQPAGSAGYVNPRAVIEPPDISPSVLSADSDSVARQVENTKFANQSHFYVVVENPEASAKQPLPPIVFNDPKKAIAYKAAVVGKTDAQKVTIRASFAANIIDLPADVISVKNSFYDMSQQRASSTDPEKSQRVSAVDINMGALRDKVGHAGNPAAALRMRDGSAWDMNDATTGWNGIVYVDVANPKGTGWASYDQSGNPLSYSPTGATEVDPVNAPGYTASSLSNSASATVADPLNTASEQTLVAVRLYNTDKVPDRTGASGYAGAKGCTLATNTTVYSVGHINADGNSATDKNHGTGYASPGTTAVEVSTPFCVACDAFVPFSPAYYQGDATRTNLTQSDKMLSKISGRVTQPAGFNYFHEMNLSLISGGVDVNAFRSLTIDGVAYSATNYGNGALTPANVINPPFGENRGGLNVRYRGSRSVLFASKYNRKNYTNISAGWENSNDEAYDLSLRTPGGSPPGIPDMKQYAITGMTVTTSAQ